MRRRKGGVPSDVGLHFRSKGAPNDHSRFNKQCKLHALAQANWLISRLDQKQFSFRSGQPRGATEVLDAIKADLTEDITGYNPPAMLNYNLILHEVAQTFNQLERIVRDMPLAKAVCEKHLTKTTATHDKVISLALSPDSVMVHDMRNERLNSPILSRMGAQFEHTWKKIGPELERTFVYGKGAERRSHSFFDDSIPKATHKLAEGPQGREFLQSKKMQELKVLAPEMYEQIMKATEGMAVSSCADCEHCRQGVKINKSEE